MGREIRNRLKPHAYSQRRSLPTMTGIMMDVLIGLRAALRSDEPFDELEGVDSRTIKALIDRDWMILADDQSRARYKISGRGLDALKVYEPSLKRYDNICPRCKDRPRYLRKTGIPAPYCRECSSQLSRRKYALGLYRRKPGGMCARCHKRPVFVASTGRAYSECRHCKNLRRRQEHKRERERLLARIQAGEHVPCCKEGCNQPRYCANNTPYEYCHRHYREYMIAYNDKRRPNTGQAQRRNASISTADIFQHYPNIGTVEHLPWIQKNGERYFSWEQVHSFAARDVPRDLIVCECGSKKKVAVEMVCPEGYAIYKCNKCQRRFRVVLELEYFFQEDV